MSAGEINRAMQAQQEQMIHSDEEGGQYTKSPGVGEYMASSSEEPPDVHGWLQRCKGQINLQKHH